MKTENQTQTAPAGQNSAKITIDPCALGLVTSAEQAASALRNMGCVLSPSHDRLWLVPAGKIRAAKRVARDNQYPAAFQEATKWDQVGTQPTSAARPSKRTRIEYSVFPVRRKIRYTIKRVYVDSGRTKEVIMSSVVDTREDAEREVRGAISFLIPDDECRATWINGQIVPA